MYERVQESYDRVAARYAVEFGAELAAKPLDRALLRALADLVDGAELAGGRRKVADIGCGPGHVAAFLAGLGLAAIGIDISPAMIEVARMRVPEAQFRIGSLLALPATDGELAGAVSFYSIIHLRPEDRPLAYGEMARAIGPGGWLLLAFHVSLVGHPTGEVMHADEWWGERVDLDFHYIDPTEVANGVAAAGFEVTARMLREPLAGVEHESQRCYLLCRRM